MATNYYYATERIYFAKTPTEYFGYYISGSSCSAMVTLWESAENRTKYEDNVQSCFDLAGFRLFGALALYAFGNSESDRDWGADLLTEELQKFGVNAENDAELIDRLHDIAMRNS